MERRKNNGADKQHQSELGFLPLFLGPWAPFSWNTFAADGGTPIRCDSPVDQLACTRQTSHIRMFGGVSKSNYMTFFCQQLLSSSTDTGHVQSGGRLRTQRTFAGIREGSRSDKPPAVRGGKGGQAADGCPPRLPKTFASSQLPDLASKSIMGFGLFGMDTDI